MTVGARTGREQNVFIACLGVVGLHLGDRVLVHPAAASMPARLAMLAGIAALGFGGRAWVRGSRPVRAAIPAVIGLLTVASGLAVAVPHAMLDGIGGADATGILAAVAGVILLGIAFREAVRGRRVWTGVLIGVPVALVLLQWVVIPAVTAGSATNTRRPAVSAAASIGVPGARDVSFRSRDGVRLFGWYVPPRSGSTVIVLHGSHGTRADTTAHVRLLAERGYGVLAYDARGHGRSEGQTNAFGWRGAEDVVGAVRFLSAEPGVDPGRIAAVGLSMGAEEALRAAAEGVALRAVVADGAGASTSGDSRLAAHGPGAIAVSSTWLTMRATELLSGEREPAALTAIVGRIRIPVLLIASRAEGERAIDAAYRSRIGRRAELWYASQAGHTRAIDAYPQAYPARVDTFLRSALR
jgi:pimeloyl-ACP methyl ester carboxylesterase